MKKKLLVASLAIGVAALVGMAEKATAEGTSTPAASGYIQQTTTGAGLGIIGSYHDLSTTGRGDLYNNDDTLQRICVYCHAPHHTVKPGSAEAVAVDYLPLWNHGVSTNTVFSMYDNGDADPDEADALGNPINHQYQAVANAPGSVSRLCLSCHDGSVAVNQYGFNPGRTQSRGLADSDPATITGSYVIGLGGDLSNHHPIGFDYAEVAAKDDEIASVTQVFGTTGVAIEDLLYSGNMECVTCHDVHNTKNTGETFLWTSDAGSRFCCTCHLKCQ